jgi:NADH dehydrogenase/NADH:ubiquinone oxidoreductase subunit G
VSEDGQLVARNRGSMSVISTFEDEPYTGAFTGNVTELCPVGALLPTQYRFEARPWEIQSVPTVCGMCPVGCNTSVDLREGKAKRVRSRNHHEIDEGWLCDKGRFAFTHLRAPDRVVDPIQRVRRRGFEPVSWDAAIDGAESMLREARGRVVVALSGSETVEQTYALAKLVRVGLDSHEAMLPEEVTGALDAYRAPLSSIADGKVVGVLGDVPLEESAPIVDLWVRKARRNGARIAYSEDDLKGADVLIWSGPGGRGGVRVAQLAEQHGVPAAFYVPATPNGRGIADAWACASDGEPRDDESLGVLIVSGDEAAGNPNVRGLAEHAEHVIVSSMFHGLAAGWADLVLPGTSYLERDGTYVNLEGRLQRLRRTATPPCPDELEWISLLAVRFDVELAPYASSVFEEVSERCYGGLRFGEVGERAALRTYDAAPTHIDAPALPEPKTADGGLHLVSYKALFSGPAVERVTELQFQRPRPEVELSTADAEQHGVTTGDDVTLTGGGASVTLRARVNRKLRAGIARVPDEFAGEVRGAVEIAKAEVTA